MFSNYFKVAIRNILKSKFFSAINILGMTLGVTACLFLMLYIVDELSFDRFHKDADRMYQVGLHARIAGQEVRTSSSCPAMYTALVEEVPDVESSTRIVNFFGQPIVKNGEKACTEERVFYADSNFFQFFSFQLIKGDAATVLKEPNSVVLTESMVEKYFGTEDPMGKLLAVGNYESVKVTGVAADCPTNSHVIFNMLLSSTTNRDLSQEVWLSNFLFTYFKLRPTGSLAKVDAAYKEFTVKYVGPEIERYMGATLKQMEEQGGTYGFFSQKMTDLHLRSSTRDGIEPAGNIMYVYFFGAIAAFIILIACINFMNLSTARSAGRAKEVGLRKTLGSYRGQMIGQFLAESTLHSFVAVVLSIVACDFLMPYFNLLSGKTLGLGKLLDPLFVGGLLGLILVVGLVAGSYPAFYLTSFNAVEVLKGKVRSGMKSKGVRSGLVVLQFFISIFLIIFTAIVFKQLRYMQNRDLGIDKHNVVILQNARRLGTNMEAFRNSLNQIPDVVNSSYTNNTFPGVNNTTAFRAAGTEQDHIMGVYHADYNHMDVLRFELAEGRYFSRDFPSDSTAILINEAAAKEFGYEKPLEEQIVSFENGAPETLQIIGVIRDFNFESLKEKVRPIAIRLGGISNQLMIRYEGNASTVIEKIEELWRQQASGEPFEYNFLDENYDELFRTEQRMSTLFSVFSGLAIFVACLGLFALSSFTAEQRTKEIGIRKAMGASVGKLTVLLSKEFTVLVLIAFVPAAGLAWWAAESWLENFAYRITIDPTILILSGLASIAIAWVTVSFQSVRAALINPAESLKYE